MALLTEAKNLMSSAAFALIGAAGYIAPRHMKAIKDIGGALLAAFDPNDSVGIIDSHFPDAEFFTEFERFDRHIDALRRRGSRIDYMAICSPNYLHDAHVRFALRSDADAICEKPMVLDPADLDELAVLERETSRKVNAILQLRLHPAIMKLKEATASGGARRKVDLTYITSRGRWYHASWKGDEAKSGGVITNIGVHFYDMLIHVFGPVRRSSLHLRMNERASGYLELEKADVRWFLSLEASDLPAALDGSARTYRSIKVEGQEFEFSEGFGDLHTESYRQILAGNGFGLSDVRPSVEVVAALRTAPIELNVGVQHPAAVRYL
jgi:UDP-N-acetyl-2-amino-2-deoxyglucuronate dehydrogenase